MSDQDTEPAYKITREEYARIIYAELSQDKRDAFQLMADYGKWLLASLLLIHSGGIFGTFTFISFDDPDRMKLVSPLIWSLVFGILLSLVSGFSAFFNWSYLVKFYQASANPRVLWDKDAWFTSSHFGKSIFWTYIVSMTCGVASALCIPLAAYFALSHF